MIEHFIPDIPVDSDDCASGSESEAGVIRSSLNCELPVTVLLSFHFPSVRHRVLWCAACLSVAPLQVPRGVL